LPSDNPLLTSLKLEFAYFSGRAWQSREVGGAGVILRFQRIRPRRGGRFQPLRAGEITPRFLDRTIRALKRWNYEFVSMDEVCRRAVILSQPRRFVCLTFDGGYKDLIYAVNPILSRHGVPFAACRVIIDPAERTLPPAALVGMRADGRPDVFAVVRSLCQQPRQMFFILALSTASSSPTGSTYFALSMAGAAARAAAGLAVAGRGEAALS